MPIPQSLHRISTKVRKIILCNKHYRLRVQDSQNSCDSLEKQATIYKSKEKEKGIRLIHHNIWRPLKLKTQAVSGKVSKAAVVLLMGLLGMVYQSKQLLPPETSGPAEHSPVTSSRIRLRDGRYLAYRERGVPKEKAKHKIILVHGLGSSKEMNFLAPQELIDELGISFLLFDRAGYGESDPDPKRTVKSEALDIQELADQLQLGSKFYVIGVSMGSYSTWSCLKYIPDRQRTLFNSSFMFFFSFSVMSKICLESLEVLNLTRCSRLNKLPDSIGNMTSLHKLHLGGTAIKNLPLSFESLYPSLAFLDISDCSRLETIPKNMISGMKHLKSLYAAGSGSDLISLLIPNSFSGSGSLTHLYLSNCNLSDGAIPSDHFSCLSSLLDLNLSRNKFTRIPNNAWQLSSLTSLDLSYCNLLDGVIPNDLSCLSSLLSLKLSGNKFMRIPDSVGKLSHLRGLYLEDCSQLQVLRKLPLVGLFLRNCPSLKLFYNQMDIWTSNEKLLPLDCSVVTAYIDHDGKPFKSLHLLPPSPLWSDKNTLEGFYPRPVCGPALVGSEIPEWFNDKSTNSKSRGKQMHTDEWKGYALFIVYQVHEHDEHESSNSRIFDGANRNLPHFICQFQFN